MIYLYARAEEVFSQIFMILNQSLVGFGGDVPD
jgi:hypothetical protein